MIQLKKDFLSNIFEEDRAKSLLADAANAAEETEQLHKGLLQRKARLQVSGFWNRADGFWILRDSGVLGHLDGSLLRDLYCCFGRDK